jgi:sigma-E factor negative regulatory protein RseB
VRRSAAITVLTGLAIVVPMRAWGTPSGDDTDAANAARLIERMRDAPTHYDFRGSAVIGWQGGGHARQAEVQIRDANGALEVSSAGNIVFDDGSRTYLRDQIGWTSMLVEPPTESHPAPGKSWSLSTRPGRTIAGRPTTQIVVSRRDGSTAQRLFVDHDTGLLIGRQVLGPGGRVERSVMFTGIEVGDAGAAVDQPTDVQPEPAQGLKSVPDGYRAPSSLGVGFQLATRSRHPGGILLYYSDGIFSVSVFEQRGDLDWDALLAGGTTRNIAGNRTRRYLEPSGEVLVWEHEGLVYTCVSDAPSDVFEGMVEGLSRSDRSGPEAVVDFVLGPFGWG